MSTGQTAFEFASPVHALAPSARSADEASAPRRSSEAVSRSVGQHSLLAHDPPFPTACAAPPREVSDRERAQALERALRARGGLPLRLTITDNRRTMLSLKRRNEGVEVRLHHMFLHGDAVTWDALGDYLFDGERSAAQCIARYIERHRERIRRELRRPIALCTAGAHHDLSEIFDAINRRYFQGAVDAHITWGRDPSARSRAARRSIKLGSYTSRDRLIRVHPALDADFVPRFFVEYIVYHEMLHHVLPPKLQHGRRELHGPAFKAREREFSHYHVALRWEREHLDRLLRQRQPR
jgi:hypothetical protein